MGSTMARLLSRLLAAGLAGLTAAGASALSVGRPEGLPAIGRPLELAVPLALHGQAMPDCVAADLRYGEWPVPTARTSLQLEPGPDRAVVRVRSSVAVNEPTVSIALHVGCGSRVTRQLVVLAETPESLERRNLARTTVPVPDVSAVDPAWRPRVVSGTGPGPDGARTLGRPGATQPRKPRAPAAQARPALGDVAARTTARRERLQLGAAEPARAAASLRLTPVLLLPAGEADPARRAAAAALWRVLNGTVEEQARGLDELQRLEGEVRALRTSVRQHEVAATALRTEVAQARAERYTNPVTVGASGLAAVALALAAWAWLRGRRRQARATAPSDFEHTGVDPTSAIPATSWGPTDVPDDAAVDVDLDFGDAGEPASLPAGAPKEQRVLWAVALHDAQQEAAFHLRRGEYGPAVQALVHHIRRSGDPGALAWLEVLFVHHAMRQREPFERTRAEFQSRFRTKVPSYDEFHAFAGPGLEAYPLALSRVVAAWPSPRALDALEDLLFRPPAREDGRLAFSLEAYREMLLLHQVLTEGLHRIAEGRS